MQHDLYPAGDQRVHAAAFGFDHPEWVLGPLARLQVERFHLLENPGIDRARAALARKGIDIDVELSRAVSGETRRVEVDLWDPPAVGHALGAIACQLPVPLCVNVSTGPNTVAVGATLASIFWPVDLYHVSRSGDSVLWLPTMAQRVPPARVLTALQVLCRQDRPIQHKVLRKLLAESHPDVFQPGKPGQAVSSMSDEALHGQLRTMLGPLLAWRAVEETGTGSASRLAVTDSGRSLLRLLVGWANPD